MPGFIGFPELLLLLVVALLVFGPKRLPEMGRSLGRGMREFKESVTKSGNDEPAAERPASAGTAALLTGAPAPVEPLVVTDAREPARTTPAVG